MKEHIKKSKITALVSIAIFLLVLGMSYFLMTSHTSNFQSKSGKVPSPSMSVIFDQPNLIIFSYRQILNQYPDTIKIHYPYFLVITPGNVSQLTTVYDLAKGKQVAILDKVALDYLDGDVLYTKGKYTYFDSTQLPVRCDYGFIQSKTKLLCITAKTDDPLDNRLVGINPKTQEIKELVSSQNFLSSVTLIQRKMYLAQQNIETNTFYLSINQNLYSIPTQADVIYPIGNRIYFATFKASEQGREARTYELNTGNNETTPRLATKGTLLFQ